MFTQVGSHVFRQSFRVSLFRGQALRGVGVGGAGAVVELADGRHLPCRAVVGCDGVRSRIARSLGLPPPLYAGEVYYR